MKALKRGRDRVKRTRDPVFDQVFADIFPRAVVLAERILGNHAAAEDAAAEALAQEIATLRAALGMALRALPRRQRQVVALRHLAGLSESEVASALGLSLGTVKTHTRRGIEALRAQLSMNGEEATILDRA